METRNHTLSKMDNRGQTLVEFALVVSLLLAILFGIAEFGRAWFYSNHLTNSVRAAARYGAVLGDNYSDGAVEQYLRDEIDAGHMDGQNDPPTGVTVNSIDTDSSGTFNRGDIITVTVSYDFEFLVGQYFLEMFSKDATWTMTRTATMRYEGT